VTSPTVVCGRCGATNPQAADFCASCGAFMAAYQAPAGATDQPEALARPAEATPITETIYTPPAPSSPEPSSIDFEPEPVVGDITNAPEQVALSTDLATATISEPEVNEPVSIPAPEPAPPSATPTDYPARLGKDEYVPPPSPPPAAPPEQLPPAPAIFKKVFGEYAEDVYYPTQVPGARRSGTSPQSLILIGIAALMGVCVAAAVASSNGTFVLLIGGPLAVSLIAIGVLMLVGRYPTGRP
jgi:hypothetical protein